MNNEEIIMNARELVTALEEIIENHGENIPVSIVDDEGNVLDIERADYEEDNSIAIYTQD